MACIGPKIDINQRFQMKFYDNHIHSNYSPDSKSAIAEYALRATELGLGGIAITDHLDIDAPLREDEKENPFIFDPIERNKEIDRIAATCNAGIFKGIEVGLQPRSIEKIKEFTSRYEFDSVIASLHFIDGEDPYFGEYYIGKEAKYAYGHAYEVMYKTAVDYYDFDILGHYDYIARYAPYSNRDITYREYSDLLDPLLRFLAQEGKTFEINTKTYREQNGYTPKLDLDILKRFRELGGEAISLGSDAHEPHRVAENFEKFSSIVKECGFKWLVHFEKRKPVFSKIC